MVAEHNGKGLKVLAFTIFWRYHCSIFSKYIFFLESGFHSFLELQKSLQVNYLGLVNTMAKGFKALAFTVSEVPNSIFSKHIFTF